MSKILLKTSPLKYDRKKLFDNSEIQPAFLTKIMFFQSINSWDSPPSTSKNISSTWKFNLKQ